MSAALVERLRLEAQIHAQEARTANATIAEIYEAVTGKTGEPGSWNGAKPVIAELKRLREALAAVPAGWKLVPIEPTENMLSAGGASQGAAAYYMYYSDLKAIWAAMLASAPSVPQEKP